MFIVINIIFQYLMSDVDLIFLRLAKERRKTAKEKRKRTKRKKERKERKEKMAKKGKKRKYLICIQSTLHRKEFCILT